jgi:hypothetical protein
MSFDVVLIAVLVGGIGLSAAYVTAEYRGWRKQGAALRRREAALRDLHAASFSEQHEARLLPSVVQLQGFGDDEAANPDGAELGAQPSGARANSSRDYSFGERRKRDRKRATRA